MSLPQNIMFCRSLQKKLVSFEKVDKAVPTDQKGHLDGPREDSADLYKH